MLWEEKNLEPKMKNENSTDNGGCDTTGNTPTKNDARDLSVTTREKASGIYKIVNKVNGKYYVGSSKDIYHRWYMHLYYLNKNSHRNPHLQAAWNKYEKQNFEFIIIENCEVDKCIITEQTYLDVAKQEQSECYNLSFIANKIEMTDVVKNKIRQSNSKRIWSSESLKKLSDIHKGRTHSSESINKIRLANTGVIFSNERKRKMVRRNNNIYTIIHEKLNIKWEGTMYSIQEKLNVSRRTISAFVHKHYKSCRGWTLLNIDNISINKTM